MAQSQSLGTRPRLLLQGGAAAFRLSPFELVVLAALLGAAAFAGYTAYARLTDLHASPPTPPTYLPAFRTNLTSTVSTSGTVQSSQQVTLTFGSAGKIKEFLVGLGAQVKAGQPLARIDDTQLQQALQSAQASLESAQARLDAALLGPSATDLATNEQSLVSARNQVATAQRNLDDLLAKPTLTELATAQQGVLTAQNQLQTATDNLLKAQNDLAQAQTDLATANENLAAPYANLQTAYAALGTAFANCTGASLAGLPAQGSAAPTPPAVTACSMPDSTMNSAYTNAANNYALHTGTGTYAACYSPALAALPAAGTSPLPALPDASSTAGPCGTSAFTTARSNYATTRTTYNNALAGAANLSAYSSASASYNTARTSYTTALTAVSTKQTALTTAQNALSNGNLARSVQNAQLSLANAQQKFAETAAGPKAADIDASRRSLESAQATLSTAQTRYNALFEPAKPETILPLRASVEQSRNQVETAKKNLADATIVAPFDGQISQMNGEVGSQVGASVAVFILLNPRMIRIDANADQSDVGNLKVGQTASVTFDALPGRAYSATISAIGLTPVVQQGVVTYVVTFAIDTNRLAEGTPIPSPGMTASLQVTTSRTENALVVPARAIRGTARTQRTVTVKTADGEETRQVTTGTSNGTLTQIVSGLGDGDLVLVSAPASTGAATTIAGQLGIPGGFPGGGGQQTLPVQVR